MNPSAPSDTQVFRAAFRPMFLLMFPLGLGIGLGARYFCQGLLQNDWQRIDGVLMEALTGAVWFLFCAGLFAETARRLAPPGSPLLDHLP